MSQNMTSEKQTSRLPHFSNSLLSLVGRRDGNLLPLALVTIATLILMSVLNLGMFFTWSNFMAISYGFPEFGIFSIAIMITMLTGGIDLSIVSVANLSGAMAALLLTKYIPVGATLGTTILWIGIAVVVSLLVGVLCGWINGLLISKIHIPEILATLGTMQLFTGIAIVITKGHAISGFPNEVLLLGNGAIAGIPVPLLLFIIFSVTISLVLRKTNFGFELYMLGTNRTAAQFSGINNAKIILKTYMLSGVLSAVAGLLIISRSNSAKADYGTSYLLQTIVVAVLGGINPSGGAGSMAGLVLAVICEQLLSSGFDMMQIGGSFSNYAEEMAWGIVLLFVMVINYFVNKKRRNS